MDHGQNRTDILEHLEWLGAITDSRQRLAAAAAAMCHPGLGDPKARFADVQDEGIEHVAGQAEGEADLEVESEVNQAIRVEGPMLVLDSEEAEPEGDGNLEAEDLPDEEPEVPAQTDGQRAMSSASIQALHDLLRSATVQDVTL